MSMTKTMKEREKDDTKVEKDDELKGDKDLVEDGDKETEKSAGDTQSSLNNDKVVENDDEAAPMEIPQVALTRSPRPVTAQVGAFAISGFSSTTRSESEDTDTAGEPHEHPDSDVEAPSPDGIHVVEDVVDVLPKANAIEDAGCHQAMKPVAAKSMEQMIVWSRKKTIAVVLLILTIGIVLGIVIPIQQNKQDSSPNKALDLGTLESCDPDPQTCGCFYTQADYRGSISVTESGKTCQAWAAHVPHEHKHSDFAEFPEHEGHNYCRNPDSNPGGAWCYTIDPNTRWELCDVPTCPTNRVISTVSPTPPPIAIQDTCTDRHNATAIAFDGIHSRIHFVNSTSSKLNVASNFTFQAWTRPTEKYDFSTIFSNKAGGDSRPGLAFTINGWRGNDAKLHLEGTSSKAQTLDPITWDTWQHIALTFNGKDPAFFVNGNQLAHVLENIAGPFRIYPSYLDTMIGDFPGYDGVGGYAGRMADVRIYDHARTVQDIRRDMHCPVVVASDEPGLLAYYPFGSSSNNNNNNNDTVVSDESPHGYHGTFQTTGEDFYVEGVSLCNYCADNE